jgi:hypothetical protein
MDAGVAELFSLTLHTIWQVGVREGALGEAAVGDVLPATGLHAQSSKTGSQASCFIDFIFPPWCYES